MGHDLFIKPPFPRDETANSLLERIALLNTRGSVGQQCRTLLSRYGLSLDSVPGGLNKLCEALGYTYGDEEEMLIHHTLFNMFTCGMEPKQVEQFRRRLVCGHVIGPLRPSRLPVLFTPAEQEHLGCAECDEKNIRVRGFVFTYRQHIAPFVQVCPWHGTPLGSV